MIWRSTLALLTSFAAFTVAVDHLRARAESAPYLLAQASLVDPGAAIDTGEAVPDFHGAAPESPLESATSDNQVAKIKALQQELKNRGYYNGPIDGIYGPATDAAVRALRGQGESNSTANLLNPQTPVPVLPSASKPAEAAPEALPEDAAAPGAAPEEETIPAAVDAGTSAQANGGDDSDGGNAAGGIDIGDQVSPDTGVPAAARPETDSPAAPAPGGPGSILWAGLALIAALGSFAIGFVLVNRAGSREEDNAPWGDVPVQLPPLNESPQDHTPRRYSAGPSSSRNGAVGATSGAQTPPSPAQETVPMVSTTNGAASSVSPLAKVGVIDELVANLQVTNPTQRRKAIWELGQRGNSSAVQPLVNSMVDADSKEKSLILAALSEIGIRSLKPMNRALAIALQDDNPDVRKNAIRDLTRVYELVTQISQMLGHATEDEDPEVRRTAEWALGQLNRIREAPQLKSSMGKGLEAAHTPAELLPEDIKNVKN